MPCPWLLAVLCRSTGATERQIPATNPGDNTVFDASPLQVLTGENPKQRHARTPRPDAADPKSNPGSPYQRHEGTFRPDAANPCAGELIAASCICSIGGGVGRGVGILLAVLSIVAMLLGSCWARLLPVCVAVLQLVQTPDSPLPPAHCCLCCESDSRQCVLCAAAVGAAHLQAALGQAPAPRSTQGPLRAFGSAAAQVCQDAQGVLPAGCYLHGARPARLASRDRRAVVDFLQGQPAST